MIKLFNGIVMMLMALLILMQQNTFNTSIIHDYHGLYLVVIILALSSYANFMAFLFPMREEA